MVLVPDEVLVVVPLSEVVVAAEVVLPSVSDVVVEAPETVVLDIVVPVELDPDPLDVVVLPAFPVEVEPPERVVVVVLLELPPSASFLIAPS